MAPSKLWRKFTKIDRNSASCNECKKVIKTTNLKSHFDMHLKKAEAGFNAPKNKKPKQQQLSTFGSCSVQNNTNISNDSDDPDVKKKLFLIIYKYFNVN